MLTSVSLTNMRYYNDNLLPSNYYILHEIHLSILYNLQLFRFITIRIHAIILFNTVYNL